MPRSTRGLTVSEDQERQIQQWLVAQGTPQQVALRCRIVLAAGHGESEASIAAKLDVNRKTVRLWRERFMQEGVDGVWGGGARRGRKSTYHWGPGQAGNARALQS